MPPTKFGFGQAMRRTEDDALLRGAGRYVADHAPDGVLHAVVLRSPHAHARFRITDVGEGQGDGGRRARAHRGGHRQARPPAVPGGDTADQGRHPALSDPGARRGASTSAMRSPSWWPPASDQARDAAEAIAIEWDALPHVIGAAERARAGRAAGVAEATQQSRLRDRRSATPRRPRARSRRRRARCRSRWSISAWSPTISTRARSSPSTRGRPLHAHLEQPGQPQRPRRAVPGRARDQAGDDAGGDARRRRRLRHQALSLSRIRARRRRGAPARAAGQMGRRPQRAFPRRRPGTRQYHDGEAGARCRRALSRTRGRPRRRHGRLSLLLRAVHSLYRRRHVARRLRHSGLPRARARRFHQYGAGRCLSRRRPARRPPM